MLVPVGADAAWRDEHREQVVIELDLIVCAEAAQAHEPGHSSVVRQAGELAGTVMRDLIVDAVIDADIIRRGEHLLKVIQEPAGLSARVAAHALGGNHER